MSTLRCTSCEVEKPSTCFENTSFCQSCLGHECSYCHKGVKEVRFSQDPASRMLRKGCQGCLHQRNMKRKKHKERVLLGRGKGTADRSLKGMASTGTKTSHGIPRPLTSPPLPTSLDGLPVEGPVHDDADALNHERPIFHCCHPGCGKSYVWLKDLQRHEQNRGFREFVRNDTNVAPTAPLTVHDVVPLIPQAVQNELHGTLSTPIDEKEEDDAEWEPDPNCSPDQA